MRYGIGSTERESEREHLKAKCEMGKMEKASRQNRSVDASKRTSWEMEPNVNLNHYVYRQHELLNFYC